MPPVVQPRLAVFSHGFHFEESVRAILACGQATAARGPVDAIVPLLSQPSPATRLRLAQKIVQRFFPDEKKRDPLTSPLLELVRGLSQTDVQRELLFYELTKTDALVGALARSIFYPHFVERRAPAGYSAAEFRVANGGALLDVRKIVSADFAEAFAARVWGFQHPSVVRRALHILEEAGVVHKVKMTELRGHPLAYRVGPRDLSLTTFLYCLHDEFGAWRGRPVALQRIARSRFARTFVLWPEQVRQLAAAAARYRFVAWRRTKTSSSLRLSYATSERFVEALLARFGNS